LDLYPQLWDIETKKQLKTFTGHGNSIRRLVSLPSGAHFASVAHEDGALNIWDGAESSVQTTAVAGVLDEALSTL
jgi:WD40 repeat protein